MGPKLSVVVPFYGVESYIDACLSTIAAQTFADFECILVDDGSPDGSRAIAERHAASDPRFRIVTQPNAGLGAARNTGTRHARGEYLMFVDSDDLLAPRAFAQLVTTLDASGSDFAGGNVWRLSPRWGLFVSTAHDEEFAERRSRVTIADVPLLMRDRMIWNKVYRRSFWDARGYAFPEMRYEDYPVTLKAHLEASAVDLLPDPLYVWRERESGTSISQQGFDIANVRDRVRAVHLVLDFVDDLASDEVKTLVASYFVQVDLREVMTSLLSVPAADQDEVERLLASMADRLEPARVGHAPAFNQLFYRAARAHDWPLCRALARWSAREGWPGVFRELPRSGVRTPLRASALADLARTQAPHPLARRALEARVAEVRPVPDGVELVADVKLRSQFARVARVRVSAGEATVPATWTPGLSGLRLAIPLTSDAVGALPHAAGDGGAPLTIDVNAGPLRWRGPIVADAVPPIASGVQVGRRGGNANVRVVPGAVVADRVEIDGDELVIHLATPGIEEVAVERPYPDAPVIATVSRVDASPAEPGTLADPVGLADHVANADPGALAEPVEASGPSTGSGSESRFSLAELLAGDPADNAVTHVAERPIVARAGGRTSPVFRTCADVSGVWEGRPVSVVASDDGHLLFVHGPKPADAPGTEAAPTASEEG